MRRCDKPLIAMLVGGETNPFIMNRKVAEDLVATARWVVDELGGTPYVTTSRRTTPEVVEVLRRICRPRRCSTSGQADAEDNPYRALLGSADGFIVTADSVSMMVEVIYLHKPLAIFPLPGGWLGDIDQLRRSLAHWLFNPRQDSPGIAGAISWRAVCTTLMCSSAVCHPGLSRFSPHAGGAGAGCLVG